MYSFYQDMRSLKKDYNNEKQQQLNEGFAECCNQINNKYKLGVGLMVNSNTANTVDMNKVKNEKEEIVLQKIENTKRETSFADRKFET